MKAQRRHELQENVLAHELGKIKDFFNRYGNWIMGVSLAALIVLLVVWHYRSRSASERIEQMNRFETLRRDVYVPDKQAAALEGLIELAEDAKDPFLSASASMYAADFCTEQYVTGLRGSDSEKAREYRKKAEKYYRRVIEKHSGRKVFAAKAHLGLGMLAESAGDWATARAEYKRVDEMLDDVYPAAVEAQRRLNKLQAWTRPVRFSTSAPAFTLPATAPGEATTKPETKPARTETEK